MIRNIQEIEVSQLGFGLMRLPILSENTKDIDYEKSLEMFEYALLNGVNYFDTAYIYHGGESEIFLGKALEGRRDCCRIADKFPTWLLEKTEDFERIFEEQCEKLKTDYIDFYLIHSLTKHTWNNAKEKGVFRFIEKLKESGRVKKIGFSFHDHFLVFEDIIKAYPWDFCQIQYNYADIDYQAGDMGLQLAGNLNIPVVVMEPLKGGSLIFNASPEIKEAVHEVNLNLPEACFRFIYSKAQVSCVLSGMSNLEQMKQNIDIAKQVDNSALSSEEELFYHYLKDLHDKNLKIPCTACAYCMPCPHGVDIPENFKIYNRAILNRDKELEFANYYILDKKSADHCKECNICLRLCPQQIPIPSELKKTHAYFEDMRE